MSTTATHAPTCTSSYGRNGETAVYACTREDGHNGVHAADGSTWTVKGDWDKILLAYEMLEVTPMWTDWEAFGWIARTGDDAAVLAAGNALAASCTRYAGWLADHPRYAPLAAA